MHLVGPLLFTILAVVSVIVAVRMRSGVVAAHAGVVAELARRGIRHSALGPHGELTPGSARAIDAPRFGVVLERGGGLRASVSSNSAQGAATLPGFGPVHPQQALVELDLPLPDQMICAHDRAQAVFGPFPPAPQRTGNPGFDQRFGIFVRPEEAQGYRPAPSDPAPWAHAPAAGAIFSDLDTLGFVALHVHGGRGRMLFAPHAIDGLVSALDVAAAIARPQQARIPVRRPTVPGASGMALVAVIFLGLPIAGAMPMLPYFTETGSALAGSEVACPRGGTFRKGFKSRADSCKLLDGTVYRASGAYTAWQLAVWAPLLLAMAAAGAALFFKTRRDAARDIHRSLAQG